MVAHVNKQVSRVPRQEDGFEVHAIEQRIDATGRLDIDRVGRRVGNGVGQIEGDAEPFGADFAERLKRQPMGEMLVMHRGQRRARVAKAGGVLAGRVTDQGGAKRLVERRPVRDPIAERVVHRGRVLTESVCSVAVCPSPTLLHCLGKIPVVEGEPGQDARLEQLVDQAAVKVQAFAIDLAIAWLDSGPAGGEAVCAQAELLHQGDVLRHPVVVIRGCVRRIARRAAGNAMRQKVWNMLAPSIRPASTSSSGSAWAMYWVIQNTPKAVTRPGTITAPSVPVQPNADIAMKSGTTLS